MFAFSGFLSTIIASKPLLTRVPSFFAGADFFISVSIVVLVGALLDWSSPRGLQAAALQVIFYTIAKLRAAVSSGHFLLSS